jgi:sodium/potassium-transporting ATPase subunit alpha
LTRRASTYSVHSLSSVRSGQRTVDPSIILPVQYRTLSYDITNVKAIEKAKDAREKAAVGESHWRQSPANLC